MPFAGYHRRRYQKGPSPYFLLLRHASSSADWAGRLILTKAALLGAAN